MPPCREDRSATSSGIHEHQALASAASKLDGTLKRMRNNLNATLQIPEHFDMQSPSGGLLTGGLQFRNRLSEATTIGNPTASTSLPSSPMSRRTPLSNISNSPLSKSSSIRASKPSSHHNQARGASNNDPAIVTGTKNSNSSTNRHETRRSTRSEHSSVTGAIDGNGCGGTSVAWLLMFRTESCRERSIAPVSELQYTKTSS